MILLDKIPKLFEKIGSFQSKFTPRGIHAKIPRGRGVKICQIPRGLGEGDPRGINPTK